jgi:hypothetical protein
MTEVGLPVANAPDPSTNATTQKKSSEPRRVKFSGELALSFHLLKVTTD